MDVASYSRCFEESLASYSGDDPSDPWEKFVDFSEKRQPAGGSSEMSSVFDASVQRFLDVDRYADDLRYVNYCIRCAGYYSDPAASYAHVFSKGVGTRTAASYLAWASQSEQKGMKEQAEAVYQKAVENQAQPADAVLHEYRQFQSRTRTQNPASGSRVPSQNSQSTNQMPQNKASADAPAKPPQIRTVITVSRSETSGTSAPDQNAAVACTVAEYSKDESVCEGSEFCFEEVRAEKYFRKIRKKQEEEQREIMEKKSRQQEEEVQRSRSMLEQVNQGSEACGGVPGVASSQQSSDALWSSSSRPRPSVRMDGRRSVGSRLHPDSSSIHEGGVPTSEASRPPPVPSERSAAARADPRPPGGAERMGQMFIRTTDAAPSELRATPREVVSVPEPEENPDVSQGGTSNSSHVTPNTSSGFVQATPSRVSPSPTVNTREASDVIMDMFQAPTFSDEPFQRSSAFQRDPDEEMGVVSSLPNPPTSAPFAIFQDEEDKENASTAAPPGKSRPARGLAEISGAKADKPNETPSESIPDESTMWGARYNSLNSSAACPNSTTDFASSAQFVSTPFTHKAPFFSAEENNGDCGDGENAFIRRQTKKLSPIMEQSPCDDQSAVAQPPPSAARQGTIMADGFISSSISSTQSPPPAVLSFRDQTLCPAESSRPNREPFKVSEDPERSPSPESVQNRASEVPMSPACAPTDDWLVIRSPEATAESDSDAFPSPSRAGLAASVGTQDVPMSPEPTWAAAEAPSTPRRLHVSDQSMTSPDRVPRRSAAVQSVSDPWDTESVSTLSSSLRTPSTSDPRCITWPCSVPRIAPKMTLSMGNSSLRVDYVLGEGAFATVFQATDPVTSEKMVLKVQKPANPWEFYINNCSDARSQPDVRHSFGSIRAAHSFHDGSVMSGESHNYGTSSNAVNVYRASSDKVMPQPLVSHFTVCISHMVEQSHAARLVHADIKPDNFMSGERFSESRCSDPDDSDHGLVLIDFGQSIDMQLFPEGTAFTARCQTSGFQCTEMLSGKPWTYQTDYFGIVGTVYCMSFGTYMQVTNEGGRWRTNGVFRRNPHADSWSEFFDTSLNVPDCGSSPSSQSLRRRSSAVSRQNYSSKSPTSKSRSVVQSSEIHRAARR